MQPNLYCGMDCFMSRFWKPDWATCSNLYEACGYLAEVDVCMQGETLFKTVIEVSGGGGSGGSSGGGTEALVRSSLQDFMQRLPEPFNMVEVRSSLHSTPGPNGDSMPA